MILVIIIIDIMTNPNNEKNLKMEFEKSWYRYNWWDYINKIPILERDVFWISIQQKTLEMQTQLDNFLSYLEPKEWQQ